jgi:site-specific recombinase XerD
MEKMSEITDEQWLSVNPANRKIVEEFLRESIHLSPESIKQYTSALRIFYYWIKINAEDKPFTEIKPRDYLLYQNFLTRLGLSSSAVRVKRSAISSLNGYIEVYYSDEIPLFRNFVNKKIPAPVLNFINEKKPLTLEEYKHLCLELEKLEKWQELAYLKCSFSSGARRAEIRQFLKNIVNEEPKLIGETKIYSTGEIRCKGRGVIGKVRKLQIDEDSMNSIIKWLEIRGEDSCKFLFIAKNNGEAKQISLETFNGWCANLFTEIVGRRVHPHLFRESRATSMVVEQKKDIKIAQKLLGHLSSVTTETYVIRDDKDDSDDAFT